jgi:hypothetical protein
MKSTSVLLTLGLCLAAWLLAGCGSKTDTNSELQKAAVVIAKPETAQEAPPPAAETVQQTPSAPAAQTPAPAQSQGQEMKQAITAYKAGELEDAVARLQKLRATPVMSAEKRMALNDAMAAVMSEIYTLAEKGDPRAIQAKKLYEQMQTERH